MTANQLYSLFLHVNDEAEKIIKGWDNHFHWLEDVVLSAIESKGKTVIPKTPAARKRKRKISKDTNAMDNTMEPSGMTAKEQQAAKKPKPETQIMKTSPVVHRLDETYQKVVDQSSILETKKPTRQGRKRNITEASDVTEVIESIHKIDEISSPKQLKAGGKKKLKIKESLELAKPEENIVIKTPVPAPRQRPLRNTRRFESSPPCTPTKPPAVTKAEKVKKQKTPRLKENLVPIEVAVDSPIRKSSRTKEKLVRIEADVDSPFRNATGTKENIVPVEIEVGSPFRKSSRIAHSPAVKGLNGFPSVLSRQASFTSTDSLTRTTTVSQSKRDSALKVVKHGWSATGKTLSTKAARIPYSSSPSMDNRLKVLQMKNLSASKPGLHTSFLKSSSPHLGSRLMCPSSESRVGNIVVGMSSFVTRVQPAKLSKKEVEDARQLELEKKQEKEEEIRRKKDEMLKARTEEKKRKNEERMRRAQEVRENKEKQMNEARLAQQRERRQREEDKSRGEAERRRKEEDKLREEKERKKKLLSEKREEEHLARLIKIKEQEERETRLEAIRKEEEMKQMQERRQLAAEQKLHEMQQRKLLEEHKRKLEQRLEAQRIEKEKYEEAKRGEIEDKRTAQEMQQQAERGNPSATFTKDSSPNVASGSETTAKTNPDNSQNTDANNYEITPKPKPKPKDPNNYDIDDCVSGDSTDEDTDPKKDIPLWARGQLLRKALFDQEYYAPDADRIFPANVLLLPPNLDDIFCKKRSRFFTRTSSANWNTPPLKTIN